MNKCCGWLALCCCVLLLGAPEVANGLPLPGSSGFGYNAGDIGASFTANSGLAAPSMSYDVGSSAFSLNAALGFAGAPGYLRRTDGSLLASDLIGQFSLTAEIDRSGKIRSGAFNWTGQSSMLGMAAPTVLLSGTPVDVAIAESQGFGFDFLASVEFVHPTFEAILGAVGSLLIETFAAPINGAFFNDPWNASFSGIAADSGPDLAGGPRPIPAAGQLWTFAIGLIGLAAIMRRKKGMAPEPQSAAAGHAQNSNGNAGPLPA